MADIKKAARQYVAITHASAHAYTHRPNYFIETIGQPGETAATVKESAERSLCGDQWDQPKDISTDTVLKNLFVVSLSVAKRSYWVAYSHWLEIQDMHNAG